MFGKLLSHLLWNASEDYEAEDDTYEELMELEEGGWVIVNLPGEMWILPEVHQCVILYQLYLKGSWLSVGAALC